ncbi:hypothetical protein [Parvibaculum sp.]|jgi:hypothetical protein|uniref:hypothetical protein n=1 Tax=Parvibaculum sp. TaxID=2024848 RepID=UPI002FD9C0F3
MPLPTALRRPLKLSSRIPGAPALATLALLALAGCSSVGNMFGVVDETKDGGTTLYPCPAVGVLEGTDHVTLVTGAGTDLTDIVAKAEIGKVVSSCKYNIDESTITVDLAFDGLAELGPAATSRELTLKTFVAVTRRFNAFDKKQVYEVPVTFEAGRRQVGFVKTVEGTILPYGGTADGRIYQILIGFQLTPDQLEYNRNVAYIPIR